MSSNILREKIAEIIEASEDEGDSYEQTATKVLALPEIAEALEAAKAWQDAAMLGTGIMKDGKCIDPAEVYFKPPEPGPNEMYSHDVGKVR